MKRNKMDVGAIILIVVGVIVAMVVGIWALKSNGVLKKSGNDTIGQAAEMFAKYSDEAIAQFDGNVVSGEDVLDALKFYTDNANGYTGTVTVKTKLDTAGTQYKVGTAYAAPANNDNKYINPDGVFEGKVTVNSNNIVTDIEFTQK